MKNSIEDRLRQDLGGPRSQVPPEVREGLVHMAETRSLVDVAYATVDSPLGRLVVAATKRGLIRLAYDNEPLEATLEDLALTVSPRIMESLVRLDDVRRELDEYFDGRRDRFDLAIDWSFSSGFARRVLKATARIPFGSVSSYANIAAKAGSVRASRATGNALGSNRIPIVVPCHRVLRTGGALGGYGGGLHRKEFLLRLENAL